MAQLSEAQILAQKNTDACELCACAPPPDPRRPAPATKPRLSPPGAFSLFNRRHHCRKCARCVCADCSPEESARPIGGAVLRHCRLCVPTAARPIQAIGGTRG